MGKSIATPNGVHLLLIAQSMGILALLVAQILNGSNDDGDEGVQFSENSSPVRETRNQFPRMSSDKYVGYMPILHLLSNIVGTVAFYRGSSSYPRLSIVMTINALVLYASIVVVVNQIDRSLWAISSSEFDWLYWAVWGCQFFWNTILTLISATMLLISIVGMHNYQPQKKHRLNNMMKTCNIDTGASNENGNHVVRV